ncbi:MAG TPA: hypothetical protein VJV79_19005 [Polyangiaceae bacterium]|nr:hypothetical protein [Polyangiaceae bacterium]
MNPYAIPIWLWAASAFGLVVMLVGDEAWDALGLVCLLMPLIAMLRATQRGQPQ